MILWQSWLSTWHNVNHRELSRTGCGHVRRARFWLSCLEVWGTMPWVCGTNWKSRYGKPRRWQACANLSPPDYGCDVTSFFKFLSGFSVMECTMKLWAKINFLPYIALCQDMSSWLQNETRGDTLKFPAEKPKISSKRKQTIYFLLLRQDSLYPGWLQTTM